MLDPLTSFLAGVVAGQVFIVLTLLKLQKQPRLR